MNPSLFEMEPPARLSKDIFGAGTAVLAGFALDAEEELLASLMDVVEQSPFRNMVTPGDSARLRYHGIVPLKDGEHPRLGRVRYNLTFRNEG